MRVLLLSGLGPGAKNDFYLRGSMFDDNHRFAFLSTDESIGLDDLHVHDGGRSHKLLQSGDAKAAPHLTTLTLRSILERTTVHYEHVDLSLCWSDESPGVHGPFDAVLLSTTFIWEKSSLRRAISWISTHFPDTEIILGGQYSNLKYPQILNAYRDIRFIVLGDAENALPALLDHLAGHGALSDVPNLVFKDAASRVNLTRIEYVDLEEALPPPIHGTRMAPYESMRGCPFSCKYCSFPAASPKWRYKSAAKIVRDWRWYKHEGGASAISAMDSTFTVPPSRLRELFEQLPGLGLPWEAFSRANSISDRQVVSRLEASGCRRLAIGFESMSDKTLLAMNKRVRVKDNLRAFELLSDSSITYKISFIAGYLGETPEDFSATRDFLVHDFAGHFLLNVFSIADETMPLWRDADRFSLRIMDEDNPDYGWLHEGMDAETARRLVTDALDSVRSTNPLAVAKFWQGRYRDLAELPLAGADTLALEKAVERLSFVQRDHRDQRSRETAARKAISTLTALGVCSRTGCAPDLVSVSY